jgi:hypothetical protein
MSCGQELNRAITFHYLIIMSWCDRYVKISKPSLSDMVFDNSLDRVRFREFVIAQRRTVGFDQFKMVMTIKCAVESEVQDGLINRRHQLFES